MTARFRWRAAALALLGLTSGAAALAQRAPIAVAPKPPAAISLAGELTQGGWARGVAPAGTAALALDGVQIPFAPDGSFLIAFDRDAPATAQLVARLVDGRAITRPIVVAPRAWKIERLPIGPRPGAVPSEEFARRRAVELSRIKAARALDTGAQGWRQHFIWPARGRISGVFGSQRIYNGTPGAYHSGTDIAGGAGATIVAPADGVVVLAAESPFTLEGNLLMVDHGMGLNSAFLHCSQLLVHEGDRVRQGQPIGRIGATGRATGPHLHWSIKWRDARLDPILFTGPMR